MDKEDKQANLVLEATRDDRLRQFERKRLEMLDWTCFSDRLIAVFNLVVVLPNMSLSLQRKSLEIIPMEISLEVMNGVLNKYAIRLIWN